MDDVTQKKIKISEAAAKKYLKNDRFTIQSLADDLNMNPKQVFELFPNRSSILSFFYDSRLLIYKEQTKKIDDFGSFSLSEKLTTLFLTLLDEFDEHREFVLQTYSSKIAKNCTTTPFENSFKHELKQIFEYDSKRSASSGLVLGSAFYKILFYHFHVLVEFWKNDGSTQRQNSMALVDKWTSFIEELFYTSIIDKGVDLSKFLFYQSPLSRCNIHLFKNEQNQ